MAKKRFKSPTPEEIERISDSIWSDSRGRIVDRDTYDLHYDKWFGSEDLSTAQKTSMKEKVFQDMQSKHDGISPEHLYKEAKGKDLKRDQKQTAKVVVTDPKEFKRRGARNVDLEGLDTKRVDPYTIVGRVKGKAVYCQPVTIRINNKPVERLRDRRGRFASNPDKMR